MSKDASDHPLQPALDYFEGKSDDKKAARKAVRNAIVDGEKSPAKGGPGEALLATSLALCIKPLLRGDHEQEALLDRMLRQIKEGETAAYQKEIGEGLKSLGAHLQSAPAGGDGDLPPGFQEGLNGVLKGVTLLCPNEEGLEKMVTYLHQQGAKGFGAEYVKVLGRFAKNLPEIADEIVTARREEREAFKVLIADVTDRLAETFKEAGNFNDKLEGVLGALKKAESIEDLGQLRTILVKGVDGLRKRTGSLIFNLKENQIELGQAKKRLQTLESRIGRIQHEAEGPSEEELRETFEHRVKVAVAKAAHYKTYLALIRFEVDGRKDFFGQFGPSMGHQMLSTVTQHVKNQLHPSDQPTSYIQNSFGLILPGVTQANAMALAETIREEILRLRFKIQGAQHKVTISVGVSDYIPQKRDPDKVLSRVGVALEKAVGGGGNRVEFAE